MDNIYNNAGFAFSNMDKEQCSDDAEPTNCDDDAHVYEMDDHSTARDHTEVKNDGDEYGNVKNMHGHPTAIHHTEVKNHGDEYGNVKNMHGHLTAIHHTDVPECKNTQSKRRVKVFMLIPILLLSGALTALGFFYYMQYVSLRDISEQYANATALLKTQENKTTALEQAYEQLEKRHQNISEVLSKAQKANEPCDGSWRSFGLKCYFFSADKLDWMQSRDFCVKEGGHLVVITSQDEENFVFINANEPHWIGLNDLETEGQWVWVNKKTLDETGVRFWFKRIDAPSEPDNWKKEDSTGEDCACLWDENSVYNRWFDASCRKVKKYICQREK